MADDDRRLLILHAMRMASVAPPETIAHRSALAPALVSELLDAFAERGWAVEHRGALVGWALTAAGRDELGALLSAEVDRTDVRAAMEERYRSFVELNGPFLELCTDWQLRVEASGDRVVNDHSDPGYDAAVLARLEPIHRDITDLARHCGDLLSRFGGYGDRFGHAWERLRANDVDWLTRPLIDSYHTVWFELHEDFLATLGLTRSEERDGT